MNKVLYLEGGFEKPTNVRRRAELIEGKANTKAQVKYADSTNNFAYLVSLYVTAQ